MSKKSFPKLIRMWHQKNDGTWCHAWDVIESAFLQWKENRIPLKASHVYLPDSTQPKPFSRVVCGTCKGLTGEPQKMKTESLTPTT